MTFDRKSIFNLLDRYVKEHYDCFLAEMFENSDHKDEYMFCFRPIGIKPEDVRLDAVDCACSYISIEINQLKVSLEFGTLIPPIIEQLDDALKSLQPHKNR